MEGNIYPWCEPFLPESMFVRPSWHSVRDKWTVIESLTVRATGAAQLVAELRRVIGRFEATIAWLEGHADEYVEQHLHDLQTIPSEGERTVPA